MITETHIFRLVDGLPICRFPDTADISVEKLAKELISQKERRGKYSRYFFLKSPKFLFVSTSANILEPLMDGFQCENEHLETLPYEYEELSSEIERTTPEQAIEQSFEKLAHEIQLSKELADENLSKALERGQKLVDIETITTSLIADSKDVLKSATKLDRAAFLRKYGLYLIVGGVLTLLLLLKIFK